MWQQWTNLVAGLWVAVIPFIGFDAQAFMWTMIVTGLVIAGLGLWGASEATARDKQQHRQYERRHA